MLLPQLFASTAQWICVLEATETIVARSPREVNAAGVMMQQSDSVLVTIMPLGEEMHWYNLHQS